jgi:hypothetical protein
MSLQFEVTLFFIFNYQFPIVGQNRDFAVKTETKKALSFPRAFK